VKTIIKAGLLTAAALWIPVFAYGQSYNGWVDQANCTSITGCAWDYTNNPVSVDLYDGSTPIVTVAANQYRADLVGAGIGNGYHGFSIPTPNSLKDGLQHLVYAYYAGTNVPLNLSGNMGPNCSAPATGYQPYYAENLTSFDASKWQAYGAPVLALTVSRLARQEPR